MIAAQVGTAGTSSQDRSAETCAVRALSGLLASLGMLPKPAYLPGEVCRLLRISRTTFLTLCDLAEHPATGRYDPRRLDSYKVGEHHRVTHEALIDWLTRNQSFQRNR